MVITDPPVDPPVGVKVRPAVAADLAEVGRIAVAAYRADGQLGDEHSYEDALRDAAGRSRDSEILVAEEDGRILGAVAVCLPGSRLAEISREGELEFRMLSVDPAAQGRGVGRALVRACADRAVESGCHAVVICTRDDFAQAARRLYQRMGFTRLPDRDWTPVPGVDLIAWTLPLI
jgi:ribosomal protein S18 acetylase RimI-like enzyme